jgi:hypothetical protein
MHFPFGIIFTGIVLYVAYKIGKSAGKEEKEQTKLIKASDKK